MRFFLVLLAAAAVATAQNPLTTTFANNNGGSAGGGVFFDLENLTSCPVTITSVELNLSSIAGTTGELRLYTRPVTAFGFEGSIAGWIECSLDLAVVSAGPSVPTPAAITCTIPPFTKIGCCYDLTGLAHAYTNTSTFVTYGDCPLELTAGRAMNVPFTAGTIFLRIVNTSIYWATTIACKCATVVSEGPGCGCPTLLSLTANAPPIQPGPFVLTTGGIPSSVLLHAGFVGLSNPAFGLGGSSMPGCFLNTTVELLVGPHLSPSFPTFTWTALLIPAAPILNGFQFHVQSFILGSSCNLAFGSGAQTSNGLKCTIGNF